MFFDFEETLYFFAPEFPPSNYQGPNNWKSLREEFLKTALVLAEQYPDLEVIIKCHPQQSDVTFSFMPTLLPSNLSIKKGAEISDLISHSYAVTGFQTTALLETALANIPSYYAAWGESFNQLKEHLHPWHQPGLGVTWCTSPSSLYDSICTAICNNGRCENIDKSRLEEYFSQPDGQRARFILDSLAKTLATQAMSSPR
jgi:hypothetical protein